MGKSLNPYLLFRIKTQGGNERGGRKLMGGRAVPLSIDV